MDCVRNQGNGRRLRCERVGILELTSSAAVSEQYHQTGYAARVWRLERVMRLEYRGRVVGVFLHRVYLGEFRRTALPTLEQATVIRDAMIDRWR